MNAAGRFRLALACTAALAPLGFAHAATADDAAIATGTPDLPEGVVSHPDLFTSDDQLIFEVDSAGLQLSDGLSGYSSRAGVFLPVGELSRLLDIAITVDPLRQRAEGWVLSERRTVLIDLPSRTVRVGDTEFHLSSTEATFKDGELYLKASVLEQILPIRLKVDTSSLTLTVTPTERLPFQDRLQREMLRGQLGGQGREQPPLKVVTPYRWLTAPSLDANLNASAGNHDPKRVGSYDIRAGGDFMGAGLQLFAGSDTSLRLNSVRLLLERKDPDGRIAGPFGATRSDLGDTYTPGLTLGARSTSGRGVAITSVPLDQASVFDKVDLHGELALGYEVELYVNEVLRASQAQAVQGRYDFPDVTLAYGLNVIRLVFYGPRGERREEIRRVNVGGGQLAKGQTVYSFGAVQEGMNLIPVGGAGAGSTPGQGKWRVAASLAHGLTNATTLSVAFAQYTPYTDDTREMGTVGLATSLRGMAVQFDAAADSLGGSAVAFGVAGRISGASLVLRHSEYQGGFVDELQSAGLGASALRRDTNLGLDLVANVDKISLPMSFRLSRDEFVDGDEQLHATARLSQAIHRYLISAGWDYAHDSSAAVGARDTLNGTLDTSALVDGTWQLRGDLNYTLAPSFRVTAAALTADRNLSQRSALHLGVAHDFIAGETTLQAAQTWRLSAMDISFTSSYATRAKDLRIGIQLSFGLTFDPFGRRYRALGPGAAAGGAMAVDAFIDSNGDGRREPGERAVTGLKLQGGRFPVATDGAGRAIVTGLGDSSSAQVSVDPEFIEDAYLSPPATALRVVPRPGRVAVVPYPLVVTGEVELHMLFQRAGEKPRGISALHVELVDSKGAVAARANTEYDGTILIDGLRPGVYTVRLEQAQSERLKLALSAPVHVTIAPAGGFAGHVTAVVTLKSGG